MRQLWRIYDHLIAAVPAELRVARCLCGLHWFAVESAGVGLSMAPAGVARLQGAGTFAGTSARRLAAMAKSWNFHEAALALATINSALNAPQAVAATFGRAYDDWPDANIFDLLRDHVRGKKTTVIGHFPNLEAWHEICDLTILERNPQDGDTPDPACEWVLPESEVVIATATTLINKTLPRLLELAPQARFVLAGPTTPLTPLLFDFGIDTLAGLIVEDQAQAWTTIQEGGHHRLFVNGGRMVTISRDGMRRLGC